MSSNDERRAYEEQRPRALPHNPLSLSPNSGPQQHHRHPQQEDFALINGEAPQQQYNQRSSYGEDQISGSRSGGVPAQAQPFAMGTGNGFETAATSGQDATMINNSTEEGEFDDFRRSFALRGNPLEPLATGRSGTGTYTDGNGDNNNLGAAIDPMRSNLVGPLAPAPVGAAQPEAYIPRGNEQPYASPLHPHPGHFQSAPQLPNLIDMNDEDPIENQARRSMQARTGDRHARGRLPEPREGRFLPPDSSTVEPQMPPPKSSKRFMKQKARAPDLISGGYARSERIRDDEHYVLCEKCDQSLVVRKVAIMVRCKTCGQVSPASSRRRFLNHVTR